ncbi:Uncharacterised protein [Pluralibacter gergoviae]|nr:Uncharacterised protein [Pluralibacter gergoviae]
MKLQTTSLRMIPQLIRFRKHLQNFTPMVTNNVNSVSK